MGTAVTDLDRTGVSTVPISEQRPAPRLDAAAAVRCLMAPRGVAIIGASNTPGKAGYRAFHHVHQHRPENLPVYPIHPEASSILGVATFRNVRDIDGPLDVVIVARPASQAAEAIRSCAGTSVRAAIVLSSGFAELGEQGALLQDDLIAAAAQAGVRIVGPNCAGLINFRSDTALFFGSILNDWDEPFQPGHLALVSQSGAMGTVLLGLSRREGVTLSHLATTGNEADLQFGDFLSALADAPEVRAILGYVENIRDPARFAHALAHAQEMGKRVVLLKAGRTPAGRRSAQAHTAALAGSDAGLVAVARRYGAILVNDVRELVGTGLALAYAPQAGMRRLAVVTGSGGMGVLLSDEAWRNGLDVPELDEPTQQQLRTVLPEYGSAANPIDGTGQLGRTPQMVTDIISIARRSPAVDAVVCLLGGLPSTTMQTAEAIVAAKTRSPSAHPVLACCMEPDSPAIAYLNHAGIPCFVDSSQMLRSLGRLRTLTREPSPVREHHEPRRSGPTVTVVDAPTALQLVRASGARTPESELCDRAEDLAAAAARRSTAYMLKAHTPDGIHKSEMGAVVGPLVPGGSYNVERFVARFQGVPARFEVQDYVEGSWELLIAVTRDPDYGYMLTVGLGGLLVEAIGQVVTFLSPASPDELAAGLSEGALGAIVHGARGRPPIDLGRLSTLSRTLHEVVESNDLLVLECNPVIVDRSNGDLVVVDAHAEKGAI